MTDPVPALQGLSSIASDYDVILSDVWGVLHDGRRARPRAGEALTKYREAGGKVVLITNSPRPSPPIHEELAALGVPRSAYDDMVTSGDVTRMAIAEHAGTDVHWVGPRGDAPLFEGLDVGFSGADTATAIVVTDMNDDDDEPGDYEDEMALWLERKLPLICANPDLIVEQGDRIIYCAGALAEAYRAKGGEVIMAGKPYRPIYRDALRLAGRDPGEGADRSRILAIGDSARTDAAGAARIGIEFLFITGAIHAAELGPVDEPDPALVTRLLGASAASARGFMPRLFW